jgi:hypothetical protein
VLAALLKNAVFNVALNLQTVNCSVPKYKYNVPESGNLFICPLGGQLPLGALGTIETFSGKSRRLTVSLNSLMTSLVTSCCRHIVIHDTFTRF